MNKPAKPKNVAAIPPAPRIFSAQSLGRYLGVPKKTVLKMKFPKVVVGPKTHLYLLEDVLHRLEELKRQGTEATS